jgi:hypothetical protein
MAFVTIGPAVQSCRLEEQEKSKIAVSVPTV